MGLKLRAADAAAVGSVPEEGRGGGRPRKRPVRRKLRPARVLCFLLVLLAASAVVSLGALTWVAGGDPPPRDGREPGPAHGRSLLSADRDESSGGSTGGPPTALRWSSGSGGGGSNGSFEMQGDYPGDLFSLEERRRGAVALHMFGMLYMFIALAIVCDEFFVPALTVITEKLELMDDVAGATFMAAGGSAPELFTSVIGVFISHSNVGIGTIVGSAVFNILFVIGMCAIFSREILNLTWWPLFRDVSFYIVGLILLIVFFLDNKITCWESMGLLLCYSSYVTFMKFNTSMESFIKTLLNRNQVDEVEATPKLESSALLTNASYTPPGEQSPGQGDDGTKLSARPRLQRGGSSASLHNTLMRNSIFQLMIHTLDPLSEEFADSELGTYGKLKYYQTMTEEGKFREKASILHKMAKNRCQEDGDKSNGVPGHTDMNLPNSSSVELEVTPPMNGTAGQDTSEEDEDEDQPLSLAWPETPRKRITYLLILPIVFPLWLTLPDVRKEKSRRFFPVTFLGAISWIAAFSYLMVWWAHQVGETIGISEEIMGLTILAAGTSIPDLITSVIVARKGLGDMAVSSSVGSNIFDITVGLPFPWLLYSLTHELKPVTVSSNGLFCAIVLLFLMLIFVIISIASCKWRMSKLLGLIMFLLYFIFLVISVMLEDKVLVCPVSI
ncbi:sodium/potassium/calcium exchanger 2-like isoform X2 [Anguilla anguilla]|uniref:sodium/potassium/calcium exchanger 2-like isoform X2 n=1 Tax=Anguilla anguilla TaxID=7936 RepID=UPI0015AFC516|nr:sodium/potassium/calcium exchanger 2-like isoform X2 [Anguilla anguilla]